MAYIELYKFDKVQMKFTVFRDRRSKRHQTNEISITKQTEILNQRFVENGEL